MFDENNFQFIQASHQQATISRNEVKSKDRLISRLIGIDVFQENGTIRFRVTLEDEVPAGQQPNIVGVDAYVIVLDDNDNPPRFLNVPYEAVAEEDLPVGSTILSGIKVIDPDLLGDTIDLTCVPQPQVSH